MELVEWEMRVGVEADAGAVAVVRLNDPARRNALSAQLVAEFIEIVDEVEGHRDVRSIVITGAPPSFCAGADLGSLADEQGRPQGDAEREAGLRRIYAAFLRVSRCTLPTVAAVNGPAVGAGMNLALACDVRLAARSARFDARFLELGLHPGGGHTFLLERAVGEQATRAMVLFGERLDALEAERRGLVWRCVDDDVLVDEAVRFASRAAEVPRALLTTTKETLRRAANLVDHDAAVDLEIVAQTWSLGQPFFVERLAALRSRISSSKPD
jgi:enoyl-CoA hydratase